MNEDAFARRFYADRSELESLRIQLTVDRPADGAAEQENYSLRPENFHLPSIEFTDKELAALQTALSLLDGEFAYAEPLRLALQQITWGRPSPLRAPEQRSVALGITASAGGHELSARLAKVETAIFRNKTIVFDYYTMERDEVSTRRVDPYHLLFQGGQFYLLGYAHERKAVRVFRLSRIRGKVSYATKAEHDFHRPEDFDPRAYANRADWQLGEQRGRREDPHRRADRLAGRTPLRPLWRDRAGGRRDDLPHRLLQPAQPDLVGAGPGVQCAAARSRRARLRAPASPGAAGGAPWRCAVRRSQRARRGERQRLRGSANHGFLACAGGAQREAAELDDAGATRPEAAIRPERFARLVTLASILIKAGREGERVGIADVCATPADQRGGAARGRQRAERRQLRRRLLRAVRRDSRRRMARSRSTPSPTATTSTGPRACCRSRRRRWWRRST